MGRPADRVEGVRLITDYGAGEWLKEALEKKRGGKVRKEEVAPVVEEEAPVMEEESPMVEEEEEETLW